MTDRHSLSVRGESTRAVAGGSGHAPAPKGAPSSTFPLGARQSARDARILPPPGKPNAQRPHRLQCVRSNRGVGRLLRSAPRFAISYGAPAAGDRPRARPHARFEGPALIREAGA